MKKAFGAVVRYNRGMSEAENLLEKARNDYWNQYPAGPNLEALREDYLDRLYEKDMLFLFKDFSGYINEGIDPNLRNSILRSMPDVLDWMRGKEFDRGFTPPAKEAFKRWAFPIETYWGKNAKSYNDANAFYEAIAANAENYIEYIKIRDLSEYLYRNPKSPLIYRGDLPAYFKGVLLACGTCPDITRCEEYYTELQSVFPQKQIEDGIRSYISKYPNHNSYYFSLNGHKGSNDPSVLEWHISATNPESYSRYLIKRKTNFPWRFIKTILDNRKKRYGESTANAWMQEVWENAANLDYKCVGDPNLMMTLHFGDNKRPKDYSIQLGTDCLADKLGPDVLWYDLLDFPITDRDREQAKNDLLAELNRYKGPLDPASYKSALERYNYIAETVDPSLLLKSFFLQKNYGKRLEFGDQGRLGGLYFQIDTMELSTGTASLLAGLASIKKDYKTLAVLMWWHDHISVRSFEGLELAVSDFRKLAAEIGEEKVISTVKSIELPQLKPFYLGLLSGRWLPYGRGIEKSLRH